MNATRTSRAGQAGLFRGCCLGLLVLVLVAAFATVEGLRALAAPDLGPPPGGTAHGSSMTVIAAALAGDAASQLALADHAVVILSERDLTVIAVARNPSPSRFRNPQVRDRDGYVMVTAESSVGPFGVTAVARFTLVFSNPSAAPTITVQAVDFGVGQLGLPGFIGDRLDPRGSATLNLAGLFAADPQLAALAAAMECVSVKADGVHVGFRRPGAAADTSRCN